MINRNLIELTKKLENNSKYLKDMKDIKTSQELYEFCSSIVGGYTKEEFDKFAQNLINTEHELKALSDDKLESVSGGTIGDWLKNIMPTMPADEKEFRLNVKKPKPLQAISSENYKKVKTTAYYGGQWTRNIESAAGILGKGSLMIKMFEMVYFDDLDKMSPEELAMFALDLTDQT